MFIANNLFNLAFKKAGYDSIFLDTVRKNYYDGFMKDESKLIDFLFNKYRNTNKLLIIMPDFDVDGISSGLTLYSGLSLLGLNVELYVPDSKAGYGIRRTDIDKVISKWPDLDGIITCDVGVTAVDAFMYFKDICPDKDLYITDHHNEADIVDELGNRDNIKNYADAVVDPCRADETYEFTSVCGAFVAYHIVTKLAYKIGDERLIDLSQRLTIFTMLGSLGDTMLMHHDTLNVCQEGIKNYRTLTSCIDGEFAKFYDSDKFKYNYDDLPVKYRLPFDGLYCMYLYLRSNQTVTADTFIDFKFVSFTIVPMLNTPKRLERDMQIIYDCFCVDYEAYASYHNLFQTLDAWNTERKELVSNVMSKINGFQLDESPYIFDITDLHIPGGCYGLIATKLLSMGLPFVFVGSRVDGCLNGSGRVCSMIDGGVINTEEIVINGHDNAFGFALPYDKITDYSCLLDTIYDVFLTDMDNLKESEDYDPYRGVVHVGFDKTRSDEFDYVFTEDSVDECYDYAYDIMELDCFSKGFEKPKFVLDFDKSDVDTIKIIGKKGTTLQILFKSGFKLICFNGKSYLEAYNQGRVDKLIGIFDLNRFRGSYSVQFMADGVY